MAIDTTFGTITPINGDMITHTLTAISAWPKEFLWLIMPIHSSTSDAVKISYSFLDPLFLCGIAISLGSLLASFVCVKHGKTVTAIGILWVWISYLPTANLLPMLHARADRYLFLSVYGLALIISDIVPFLLGYLKTKAIDALKYISWIMVVCLFAYLTLTRAPYWQSTTILFEHDVAKDPYFKEGRFHLAVNLYNQGDYRKAAKHFQTLIFDIENPEGRYSNINVLSVYFMSCKNHVKSGLFRTAIITTKRMMQHRPASKKHPGIRSCLAEASESLNLIDEAIENYLFIANELGSRTPTSVLLSLARNYIKIGDYDNAHHWLAEVKLENLNDTGLHKEYRRLIDDLRQK